MKKINKVWPILLLTPLLLAGCGSQENKGGTTQASGNGSMINNKRHKESSSSSTSIPMSSSNDKKHNKKQSKADKSKAKNAKAESKKAAFNKSQQASYTEGVQVKAQNMNGRTVGSLKVPYIVHVTKNYVYSGFGKPTATAVSPKIKEDLIKQFNSDKRAVSPGVTTIAHQAGDKYVLSDNQAFFPRPEGKFYQGVVDVQQTGNTFDMIAPIKNASGKTNQVHMDQTIALNLAVDGKSKYSFTTPKSGSFTKTTDQAAQQMLKAGNGMSGDAFGYK